jgi:hypothetical protein
MPDDLVQCDCRSACHHQYPEMTRGTRANHRKDDRIVAIQATLDQRHAQPHPYTTPQQRQSHPHMPIRNVRFQTNTAPVTNLQLGAAISQSTPQVSAPDQHSLEQSLSARTIAALELMEAEIRARSHLTITSLATPLIFVNKPSEHGPYKYQLLHVPNTGLYRLDSKARINAAFLEHETRLWELLGLAHLMSPSRRKDELEDRIWREIDRTSMDKELHWNQQRLHLDMDQVVVNNGVLPVKKKKSLQNLIKIPEINFLPISHWEPGVLVSMVVTAMMTELFYVPRQGGSILLAGMQDLLRTTTGQEQQAHSLPKDPRTVYARLRLDPVTESYICCPTCWALEPYHPETDNPVTNAMPHPPIPLCQERFTRDAEICGAELWKKEIIHGKTFLTPHLTYVRQVLKGWLGRLLARPGIEDILDSYPKEASQKGTDGGMDDIWSSPAIQDLKGPDGKLFMDGPNGEGRYLFGFAVDGFNPFHNKEAKQVVSSTGFFAILLNFPLHLRHLFENMCLLGVGPGPNSPTVDHGRLNPFLSLIVKDFLEFWNPGVFFTRTHKHRSGRKTKAMLIPLISDMLAARQAAGFTSATSTHFCVGCGIHMSHIEQFDKPNWPLRDHNTHMQHAYAWKNAATPNDQIKIASKTGVRYSPLLELPYWKAIRYVLTEPMHVLDLRLIDHHCRELFEIDLDRPGGDGSENRVPRPPRPSNERIQQVLTLFKRYRNNPDLLNQVLKSEWVNLDTLWHICNDHNLRIAGKRRDWFILRIEKWVSLVLFPCCIHFELECI